MTVGERVIMLTASRLFDARSNTLPRQVTYVVPRRQNVVGQVEEFAYVPGFFQIICSPAAISFGKVRAFCILGLRGM